MCFKGLCKYLVKIPSVHDPIPRLHGQCKLDSTCLYKEKKKDVRLRGRCVVGAGRIEVKESGISMVKIQCKHVWILKECIKYYLKDYI